MSCSAELSMKKFNKLGPGLHCRLLAKAPGFSSLTDLGSFVLFALFS